MDAIDLADKVYAITQGFPLEERYGISSQMQRAAVSVSSNIAEGAGRDSDKDFAHFLSIALGSLYELESQVIISLRRSYLSEDEFKILSNEIESLQKRILSFKQHIKY
ncbi:MAG: four helix bundle protein [Paludibacteraceae bacterium]|nr:four helix bundle protein [Paludibacteraceae bacterium]